MEPHRVTRRNCENAKAPSLPGTHCMLNATDRHLLNTYCMQGTMPTPRTQKKEAQFLSSQRKMNIRQESMCLDGGFRGVWDPRRGTGRVGLSK